MQLTCFTSPKRWQSTSLSLKSLPSHSRKSYLIGVWNTIYYWCNFCKKYCTKIILIELFVAISFHSFKRTTFSHKMCNFYKKKTLFVMLSYLTIIKNLFDIVSTSLNLLTDLFDDRYVIVSVFNMGSLFIKQLCK